MNSEVVEIVALLRAYERLVNASDAEGLGGLYSADGVLLPDRFEVFEGVQNITTFYAMAFSMLTLQLKFSIDPKYILVSNNIAYATTNSTGTRLIKEANETVPEINRELWVFKKDSDDWKIARYCFNKSE
ncbi:MAG: DUF4440 domain-containing protein [Pseudomonadota bacterium]